MSYFALPALAECLSRLEGQRVMFPCHIVFDSSLCLLCNIMFKSSSVEGHQLKKKTAKTHGFTSF